MAPFHLLETFPPSSKPSVIGTLLIHGFNGGPDDLVDLEIYLQEQGILTTNMLLPGHGEGVQAMWSVGWQDWARAVRAELHRLKERSDLVFLVGHSLGGALALYTAAQETVAGVVTMCTPLHLWYGLSPLVSLLKYVTPVCLTLYADLYDPEARRQYRGDVLRWTPLRTVESALQFLPQVRAVLPKVTAPALILTARHDLVVPVDDGHAIYHLLGSRTKRLRTFHRSAHFLLKDAEREAVFARTAAFILQQAHRTDV